MSGAKIPPARSGGQGKLCRGIVELRVGAVTGLCLSQRAPFRQSVRAVDKIASNSLAIKPDPSSHKTTPPHNRMGLSAAAQSDEDLYSCSTCASSFETTEGVSKYLATGR